MYIQKLSFLAAVYKTFQVSSRNHPNSGAWSHVKKEKNSLNIAKQRSILALIRAIMDVFSTWDRRQSKTLLLLTYTYQKLIKTVFSIATYIVCLRGKKKSVLTLQLLVSNVINCSLIAMLCNLM